MILDLTLVFLQDLDNSFLDGFGFLDMDLLVFLGYLDIDFVINQLLTQKYTCRG